MKAYLPLVALTLGLTSIAACSSDTTTTTGTSSTGEATTATSSTSASGTGGAGGSASTTTGAGGSGGGATSSGASTSSTASATSSGAGGMAAFALTSTGFSEGMVIPDKFSCNGANTSPDFTWTPGPTGTLSYAIELTDKSNNLTHWVIWDIPAATTSLPADLEKKANPAIPAGAKQAKAYDNKTFGYLGPCPPNTHTYEFAVIALDVATLPNVTTASTRAQVHMEILNHDLGTATLTGTYTP
jgi:Raf kinase inhibitor-like YbhB/YbcL family protein